MIEEAQPPRRILVADDDPAIGSLIQITLKDPRYELTSVTNGLEALKAFDKQPFDVVILDVMMPYVDGFEACQRIREKSDVPIVILTSRDGTDDVVHGFELGADDYITKPFSPRELVARVKTVLRRQGPAVTAEQRLVRGRLVVDLEAIAASWDGAAVSLTATEFALLKAIAAQPRRVFTRENLMTASYVGARFVSDRTIDSHVRHIRAKFQSVGGDPI
jgi:two-component system OmpR family response regulator